METAPDRTNAPALHHGPGMGVGDLLSVLTMMAPMRVKYRAHIQQWQVYAIKPMNTPTMNNTDNRQQEEAVPGKEDGTSNERKQQRAGLSVMLSSHCPEIDCQWTTRYEIVKFLFLFCL